MFSGNVTDVEGILVGQAQDFDAKTGVTVVLCKKGATAGVDVRGSAPGTRETDLLRPEKTVSVMHAVALCGGSAFGLDAAGGVMRALEEEGIGFDTRVAKVPIVGAAVLFDLAVGRPDVRPDAGMGYDAAMNASKNVSQGAFGAGTGASCGKILPGAKWHRGGVGVSSVPLPSGAIVAAIVAVNAAGDIYDPADGRLVAAGEIDGKMTPALPFLTRNEAEAGSTEGQNTTIGVIVTNARLTKAECTRLASAGHDGLALCIRPVHTPMDGDTLFTLATGEIDEDPLRLHAAAVQAVWQAVLNGVTA